MNDQTGIKSTPDAPVFSIYASSLDLAMVLDE